MAEPTCELHICLGHTQYCLQVVENRIELGKCPHEGIYPKTIEYLFQCLKADELVLLEPSPFPMVKLDA